MERNSALPIKQRLVEPENVAVVLQLLCARPAPTRTELVKTLCQRLNLRDAEGDWQIATTARALRDLEAQGRWTLPEPKVRRTREWSTAPTRLHQPVKAALSGGMKLIFFGRFESHVFFGGFSSSTSFRKVLLRPDGFSSLVN